MTNEISREDWGTFLDEFSKRNQGRTTQLEIFGEMGAQEAERNMPLNGITLDHNGGNSPRIAILLGNNKGALDPSHDNQHLTHTITGVTQLLPLQSDAGSDEALEFVSESGEKTLLRFLPQLTSNQ